jgi:hypothetical protein
MDADGDGTLSASELASAFQQMLQQAHQGYSNAASALAASSLASASA